MDYFPRPTNCEHVVHVPLLDIIPFRLGHEDEDDEIAIWTSFPREAGLLDETYELILDQDPIRVATLLQSWAFFGLLEVICGKEIIESQWARTDDPTCLQWPKHWLQELSPLSQLRQQLYSDWPNFRALELIHMALTVSTSISNSTLCMESPVAEVSLSIQLLTHTLMASIHNCAPKPCSNILLGNMLAQAGCCPSYIRYAFKQEWGLLSAYYTLSLQSQEAHQWSHINCNDEVCVAHHVKMDGTYKTQHVHHSCCCAKDRNGLEDPKEFIGLDSSRLRMIIDRGGIPLVSITGLDKEISLEIKQASLTDEYTAISHVWADGLGNTEANSLPRCQLLRLRQNLERIPLRPPITEDPDSPYKEGGLFGGIHTVVPGIKLDSDRWQILTYNPFQTSRPALFWVDTLCIPVSNGQGEDNAIVEALKTKAMNRMNLIYAASTRVLVLDARLLRYRLGTSSMLEAYAHISLSPWMSRSWTFQEGFLARRCYFQCADSAINPLWHRRSDSSLALLSNHTSFESPKFRLEFWDFLYETFLATWTILPKRTAHTSEITPPKSNDIWLGPGDPNSRLQTILLAAYSSSVVNVMQQSDDSNAKAIARINKAIARFEKPSTLGCHADQSQLDRFVLIWNQLARRSTTQ